MNQPASDRAARARAALYDNQAQLHLLSTGEHEHISSLVDQTGRRPTWVPLLPGDVHDLDGLDKIRSLLFAGSAPAAESR